MLNWDLLIKALHSTQSEWGKFCFKCFQFVPWKWGSVFGQSCCEKIGSILWETRPRVYILNQNTNRLLNVSLIKIIWSIFILCLKWVILLENVSPTYFPSCLARSVISCGHTLKKFQDYIIPLPHGCLISDPSVKVYAWRDFSFFLACTNG